MTDVSPVIMVGLRKGEIHQIIEKKDQGNGENEEGRYLLLVFSSHIKTQARSVKNSDHEI